MRSLKAQMKTYFQKKIGSFDYRGPWMKSDCPICAAEYKFGINLRDNMVHCFRCEYRNTPINLIMELEDLKYSAVVKLLMELTPARYVEKPYEAPERKVVMLPESFKLVSPNDATIVGKRAWEYSVITRGLDPQIVKRARIGYARDTKDPRYNHLIIPFYDSKGTLIYYQARNLGSGPKFNNPKVEDFGIGKNQLMYNARALMVYPEVNIVESAINALTIPPNTTSIMSKTASPFHINQLSKAPVKVYNLLLDPDAIIYSIDLGMKLVSKHLVRIVNLPKSEDVNSWGKDPTLELIKNSPMYTYNQLLLLKKHYERSKHPYKIQYT